MAKIHVDIKKAMNDQREEDEGEYNSFILIGFTDKGHMSISHDVDPLKAIGAMEALQRKIIKNMGN
jgi:hypothetical protein